MLQQLPPKTEVTIRLELNARQRQAYVQAEQGARHELGELGTQATLMHVFEMLVRLKQICNFCPLSGASSKLEDLRQRMEELQSNGQHCLVFSQWTNATYGITRLESDLQTFRPLTYSGQLSAEERLEVLDLFARRTGPSVLLLSLRAGGVGLNLTKASYVFHFDRWWNPAVEQQASDRVH